MKLGMDISGRKISSHGTIQLWRIGVLVIGAACFALLAVGRVPSRDVHEALLTSMRAIDVDHASLQRDVLQARAGLLRNYDPLVESVTALHDTVSRLTKIFRESGTEDNGGFDRDLAALSVSIDDDEKLVERFKTDNALLRNSLSITTQMLAGLHESGEPSVKEAFEGSWDLGNSMMQFASEPSNVLSAKLDGQLDQLLRSNAAGIREVQAYVANAKMVLVSLPKVDETVELILRSKTTYRAQVLQKQYLDDFGTMSSRSARGSLLLGSISVLLCLYISILVYRLRSQTHRLSQQLDIETLTANIKQRFNEGKDGHAKPIIDSLSMLAVFFDAVHYGFAVLNTESNEVVECFGDRDRLLLAPLIQKFAGQMSVSMTAKDLHWERFFYHNLQQEEVQSLPEGALSAGSLIATTIDSTHVAMLFLEYEFVRKKPNADQIRLLGHTIVSLVEGLRTERERKEKVDLVNRLEHAQRLEAVGTLAGGIAHEFNNSLGAIMGYGEMALQLRANPPRTQFYLEEILSSGQRAKHVIDQILTLSRKRDHVKKPFDVTEAIDDIVPLVRISLPTTVTVLTELASELPAILGNPMELQQALMNLAMNAAQACGEVGEVRIIGKEITVVATIQLSHGELKPGDYVAVTVSDNGVGIAPSALPHIFEPFFTTRANRGGTGLGLAAVHGLVTGMGGQVGVRDRQNAGTDFTLYFPRTSRRPVPLADFLNAPRVSRGSGELVAVVAKEKNERLMYEEKIAALGYEPVGFGSLEEVGRWLTRTARNPDLLILDLQLSAEPRDLRKIAAEFAPIRVIFLTDPRQTGADPKAFPEITTLRTPVSSNSLATALSRAVTPSSKHDTNTVGSMATSTSYPARL